MPLEFEGWDDLLSVDEVQHRGWVTTDGALYLELAPAPIDDYLNLNRGGPSNRFVRDANKKLWVSKVADAAAAYREANGMVPLPYYERAAITITFIYGTLTKRDTHNWAASAKYMVDGIVKLGIIPDDNDFVLRGPEMLAGLDRRLGQHRIQVIIKVRPLAADEYLWWQT